MKFKSLFFVLLITLVGSRAFAGGTGHTGGGGGFHTQPTEKDQEDGYSRVQFIQHHQSGSATATSSHVSSGGTGFAGGSGFIGGGFNSTTVEEYLRTHFIAGNGSAVGGTGGFHAESVESELNPDFLASAGGTSHVGGGGGFNTQPTEKDQEDGYSRVQFVERHQGEMTFILKRDGVEHVFSLRPEEIEPQMMKLILKSEQDRKEPVLVEI
jgi:hypothetical protein